MGFSLGSLKQRTRFAGQQPHSPVLLFQSVLGRVVENETCGLLIGLEAKLFRDEPDIDIRFVPEDRQLAGETQGGRTKNSRSTNGSKSSQPLPIDKHVHEVRPHVRCIQIQLEEAVIIAKSESRANV